MEQKAASLSAEQAWWLDRLQAGKVLSRSDSWEEFVGSREVFNDDIEHAQKRGIPRRAGGTQLGIALRKLVPGLERKKKPIDRWGASPQSEPTKQTVRDWAYVLPPLESCRKAFEDLMGPGLEWPDDNDDE